MAILDVRNSLWITFLAILDQYRFFNFFYKMAAGKNLSHFYPFHIDTQLTFFFKFLTKWLPSAILDVRNSLWITFLAILDQYRFLKFFLQNGCRKKSISFLSISHRYDDKMADVSHFGCPNFTFDRFSGRYETLIFFEIFDKMADVAFDRISGHFRSICNLNFFGKFLTKWLPAAILDVRNSLLIAFLAISDRSAILDFRNSLSIAILAISDRYRFFFRRPFWMSENHF